MTVRLLVQQRVSTVGKPDLTRRIVKGLGLRGPGSKVTVDNTPSFRGMIRKVLHLVDVQEVKS